MAYAVTIQGAAGLRGSDMLFTCTSTSCSGNDTYTQGVFRAFQAQLNRFVKVLLSQAKFSHLTFLKIGVDGKIGAATVNTYRFMADPLIQGGVPLTVKSSGVTKTTLAQNADTLARTLQSVADRAGLPPGDVSVPGAPSASGAGSFGPSTNVGPTAAPLPPDLVAALRSGNFATTNLPNLPDFDEGGIPFTELVSERLPGSGPSTTEWAIYGGIGVAAIALFAFTIKRRRG